MEFKNFSPSLLRFAIEVELQNTDSPEAASMIAMAKLKEDPKYYNTRYGFVEPMRKAQDAQSPLQKLLDGNARFAEGKSQNKNVSIVQRKEVSKGQKPIAAIIDCSDSRVAPELIFDQGLGSLFVIRSAGNVINGIEIGSLEYAVDELNIKLILVLGHTGCGAVKAAFEAHKLDTKDKELSDIIKKIKPAVEYAKGITNNTETVLAIAAHKNAQMVKQDILKHEFVKDKVTVISGLYDIVTGIVTTDAEKMTKAKKLIFRKFYDEKFKKYRYKRVK